MHENQSNFFHFNFSYEIFLKNVVVKMINFRGLNWHITQKTFLKKKKIEKISEGR
jgi:hypothetical protein